MPFLLFEAEFVGLGLAGHGSDFIDEVFGDVPGQNDALFGVVAIFPIALDAVEHKLARVGIVGHVVG